MKVFAFVFFLALAGGYCEQDEKMPSFLHFDKCTLCEQLLKIISLVGGRKEPAIEHAIDSICNDLGFFRKDCVKLVHEYVPKLIDALGNGKTEQEACSYVGMCSSKKAVEKAVVKKETKGIGCSLCKSLVSFVDGLLQNNEGNIEQKVNQFCDDLPILQSECKQIVDKYLDKIIQYLKDGQDQTYICNEIGGFCQSELKVAVQKPVVANVNGQTKGIGCSICKSLVSFIDSLLQNNEGNIEQKVNQFCDDLPILQSECKQIVEKYLDEIIQYLKDGQDQTYICNQIGGFCQAKSNVAVQKAFVAHVKGQTKGVTCDICKEVAKWIVDFGVDKGLDAIEHYVDGKCDDLPFISGACKDLVNKWLGKLIGLLQQDLSPDEVCHKVHLC